MAKLLSGDNPQIPKGYGDDVVRSYIDAVPGWKQNCCQRIDELVVSLAPDVCKAVKWNTPFYGIETERWFLAFHCFKSYVKVTFFRGAELSPMPPETSKQESVRYYHIYEDQFDEGQFIEWVKQAVKLDKT